MQTEEYKHGEPWEYLQTVVISATLVCVGRCMCMNCFDKVNQYILIAVSNYFMLVNYLIIFWLHYSFVKLLSQNSGSQLADWGSCGPKVSSL